MTLYEIKLMKKINQGTEHRTVYLRAIDELTAAHLVRDKIKGEIMILSIAAKGQKETNGQEQEK